MVAQLAVSKGNAMKFGFGVVIGKFLPPHRGHKLLIDTAAGQAREVMVIVCPNPPIMCLGKFAVNGCGRYILPFG